MNIKANAESGAGPEKPVTLQCSLPEVSGPCTKEVTHIDTSGFVLCTWHANALRSHPQGRSSRQLSAAELRRLQGGQTINYFKRRKA